MWAMSLWQSGEWCSAMLAQSWAASRSSVARRRSPDEGAGGDMAKIAQDGSNPAIRRDTGCSRCRRRGGLNRSVFSNYAIGPSIVGCGRRDTASPGPPHGSTDRDTLSGYTVDVVVGSHQYRTELADSAICFCALATPV